MTMFSICDLSVLAYADGFTLWYYKAPCEAQALAAPGFFDAAADMLASGDMMLVSSRTGGKMLCVATTETGIVTAPLG